MIRLDDLAARLDARRLAAWSVAEHVEDVAIVDQRRGLQRREHRAHLVATVHHDVPLGRGTAQLRVDPLDASADDVVEQLLAAALASVGPAWASPAPAAPAKVEIADAGVIQRELDAVAHTTLAALRRPAGVTVAAAAEVLREKVTVLASAGFRASWLATALRVDALVALEPTGAPRTSSQPPSQPPSLAITRRARRADDLDLDAALASAADDLHAIVGAGPPPIGRCALWLGPEAILHGDDLGLWALLAHEADSAVERQGVSRYRWRTELAPGAAQRAEPLTVHSDGALDYATRSRPVTDDAVAIRRFPLVERGRAVGLGLTAREAAVRRTEPNGGVRNLVVAPGTWHPAPAPSARTLEIRRLHALSLDPATGDATLDIALGFEHRPDRPAPTPFTGGTLQFDLLAALALAHRSPDLIRRGAYHGPANLLLDDAELLR